MNDRRLAITLADAAIAPHAGEVLVIDETGDRKDGTKTAHVAHQYRGSIGKIANRIVSVTSLWADEAVHYPLDAPGPLVVYSTAAPGGYSLLSMAPASLRFIPQIVVLDFSLREHCADEHQYQETSFLLDLPMPGQLPAPPAAPALWPRRQ